MVHMLAERVTDNIKEDLCKELDYQFRLFEEHEDERHAVKLEGDRQRDEEYYKRIDELLRQYSAKKASRSILKRIEKDKVKENEPDKIKMKEKAKIKAQKINFFKRAVEVK